MPRIFISYRRDDSAYPAQAIYHKLAEHYGPESVVFDVDTIPPGVDFVEYLNQQVSECEVLLAVIGDSWLDVQGPDGKRRLDNPRDFVRIEIQAALRRNIPVIPVLVGKASVPAPELLPRGLKRLSRRNATEVRAGREFQIHLDRLPSGIELSLQYVSRPTPPEPQPSKQPSGEERPASSDASIPTHAPAESAPNIVPNAIAQQLTLLQPGTFLMGKGEEQHKVTLTKPFGLGIYPVTQAQYQRVMTQNSGRSKDDGCPVENVSWFNAIAFCNALSEQEGFPPYYEVDGKKVTIRDGEGYRLPTEAEWEYACRAGSQRAYCFGDDENQLKDYAWFDKNSKGKTRPVGQKTPNAWGLYDMHGNVWEWCWDWYGDYDTEPVTDPRGPEQGADRVFRGGCWRHQAGYCRSAFRSRSGPGFRDNRLGFRVARSFLQQARQ